jgi:hypothetical protein
MSDIALFPSCFHGSQIQPSFVEQRQVHLTAYRGNVGLVEEELGGMAPALAERGLLMREGEYVVCSLTNGCAERHRRKRYLVPYGKGPGIGQDTRAPASGGGPRSITGMLGRWVRSRPFMGHNKS